MKTIELKLYTWAELPEEAKATAIKDHYDFNLLGDWYDDDIYMLEGREYGLEVGRKMYFDLDRGAYVSFPEMRIDSLETFLSKCGLTRLIGSEPEITIRYEQYGNKVETAYNNDLTIEEVDKMQEVLDSFLSWCLKALRDSQDYLTSDEAIAESLEANEYDWTAEGKIY